tara:strand:+ start:73 stop:1272 length:1200 start_codon:yes stop_codon:yes gene_type:complete
MYPIDDYPDIFYIYQEMIRKSSLFSIAKFVDLFDLFRQYSCYVFIPRSTFLDYLMGGGSYACSKFPFSYTYFYYFFSLTTIVGIAIIRFYKLLKTLSKNNKLILQNILLNIILLPSTTYFLLSFHIDIPYHLLVLSFVLLTFYFAFSKFRITIYPIFLTLFFLIYKIAPDNQGILFLVVYFCSIVSLVLSKNLSIRRLFDQLSWQTRKILKFKFHISKNAFIYFFFILTVSVSLLTIYRFQILEFLASDSGTSLGEVNNIASIYINPDNVVQYELLFKYPLYIRLFGAFQGLIILTPFGIKPSLFTTFLFFGSFLLGFLKIFSLDNRTFPIYIKLFLITLILMMIVILSIFPFFSYSKYWLFLIPFFALSMSFNRRVSLLAIIFIYIELLLKSYWISIS